MKYEIIAQNELENLEKFELEKNSSNDIQSEMFDDYIKIASDFLGSYKRQKS